MKPYITQPIKKKSNFRIEFNGCDASSFVDSLVDKEITAYATPTGQTVDAVWYFDLLTCCAAFSFAASSTQVNGWVEYGALIISYSGNAVDHRPPFMHDKPVVPSFRVEKVQTITYEEDDVLAECGLILIGSDSRSITIACGIPPGSVTAEGEMFEGHFKPLYPLALCTLSDFLCG